MRFPYWRTPTRCVSEISVPNLACSRCSQTTNEDIQTVRDFDRQMSELSLKLNEDQDLVAIMQSLPSQEDCWRLYEAFKYRVYSVVPIIQLPDFEELMLKFWKEFPFSMHGGNKPRIFQILLCTLNCV